MKKFYKQKKRTAWATSDCVIKDAQGNVKQIIPKKILNTVWKPKKGKQFKTTTTSYEKQVESILKEIEKESGFLNIETQRMFRNDRTFYIADFYLEKVRLIIEIDGKYHDTPKQIYFDTLRDRFFRARRIKTVRIKNEQVERCKQFLFNLILNRVKAGNQGG